MIYDYDDDADVHEVNNNLTYRVITKRKQGNLSKFDFQNCIKPLPFNWNCLAAGCAFDEI